MKVNRLSLAFHIARDDKANETTKVLPVPHTPLHPLSSPKGCSSHKVQSSFGNPCYRALWLLGAYRYSWSNWATWQERKRPPGYWIKRQKTLSYRLLETETLFWRTYPHCPAALWCPLCPTGTLRLLLPTLGLACFGLSLEQPFTWFYRINQSDIDCIPQGVEAVFRVWYNSIYPTATVT